MSATLFAILCILAIIVVLFCQRSKIRQYVNGNIYLYCWAFMLVSNLGFSSQIQWTCRIAALVISWACFVVRGIRLRKCYSGYLILLYLLVCAISIIVSVSRLQTGIKCFELLTDLLLIWQIYTIEDERHFVNKTVTVTMTVLFSLIVITLLGFFLCPNYFASTGFSASRSILGRRLASGILGANKSSAIAALCIFWALFINMKTRYKVIIIAVSAIVMFYSQSRASLILIPIALILKIFQPQCKYRWIYVLCILVGAVFVVVYWNVIIEYLLRGQSNEDVMSLTGRFSLWEESFPYISERPILGYGFGAGGEMVARRFMGIETMHSAIFETLLGTGIIGLAILLLQLIYTTILLIRKILNWGFQNCLYEVLLIVYFVVRSFTSSGIGNWHSQEIMVWYLLMFAITLRSPIAAFFKKESVSVTENQLETYTI